MGSAISRSSSYGGTLMMPLSAQVHFAQSQLDFAEAVKAQQNTIAQVNVGTAVQNIQGNQGANSPDEAALRNFTQTLLKAFAYMGIPLLLIGGILFGVNYALNFMGQPAMFGILLICLLSFYYFVVSINQTMKANIATLKIFFLGLFISGLIAGILAFAVYTPSSSIVKNVPKIERLDADEATCHKIIPGNEPFDIVVQLVEVYDKNKPGCIYKDDIPAGYRDFFNWPQMQSCDTCKAVEVPFTQKQSLPKGRLNLLKDQYKSLIPALDAASEVIITLNFEPDQDIEEIFKVIQNTTTAYQRLSKDVTFKFKGVFQDRELSEEEVKRLKFGFDEIYFGDGDEECLKFLLQSHFISDPHDYGLALMAKVIMPFHKQLQI